VSIQKLVASSVNEGLRKIRDDYGPDAMIMKTVKRNNKVELFFESETVNEEPFDDGSKSDNKSDNKPDLKSDVKRKAIANEYQNAKLKMLSSIGELPNAALTEEDPVPKETSAYRQASVGRQAAGNSFDRILGNIKGEVGGSEKSVAAILSKLNLDPAILAQVRDCRRLDELVPALGRLVSSESGPLRGIKAFVGPAGSGKTTSLLKLVTRHVLQFGAASCAIINCDRYRSGAKEQLQRMGELLDVQVINTNSEFNINQAIAKVAHRDLVVIDMPGLGCTDPLLKEEMRRLSSSNYEIGKCLVLPANFQGQDMEKAYKTYGKGLWTSTIFTHIDDCSSLGTVLSFLAKTNLKLAYLSDGPHIPENISAAAGEDLVRKAIGIADKSLLPFMMGSRIEVAKRPFSDFTKGEDQGKVKSTMVADV